LQEVGNPKRTENLVLIRNDLRRDMDSSNWEQRTGAAFRRVVRLTAVAYSEKSYIKGCQEKYLPLGSVPDLFASAFSPTG
jgi:hypothetical protein